MSGRAFLIAIALAGCSPDVPSLEGAGTDAPWAKTPSIDGPGVGGRGPYAGTFAELTRAVESDLALQRGTGLVVGVIVDGRLAHQAAFGDLRSAPDASMTEDVAFPVGLISETVTALAVLSAVDEGLLDLDRPVPELPEVTLHQLLTHSSGIGRPENLEHLPIDWSSRASLGQLFSSAHFPQWSPPGRVWNHQAFGSALAGRTLERATNTYFDRVAHDRVLRPLGMFGAAYEVPANAVVGHSGGAQSSVEVEPQQTVWVGLPGWGLFATLEDLARVAELVIAGGGGIVSEASMRAMTTPHVDTQIPWWHEQGYGVLAWRDAGLDLVAASNGGGGTGTSVQMILAPGERFGVIAMTDCDWFDLSAVSYRAFELFLGAELTLAAVETTPFETLSRYMGDFEDPDGLGRISVDLGFDALSVRFDDFGYRTNLSQLAANVFMFDLSPEMQTRFGTSQAMVTFYEGDDTRWFVTGVGVGEEVID